jgi:6-phosphogluconolactonase
MIQVRWFENAEAWMRETADLLQRHMAKEFDVPHAVVLAGGQTPRPVYQALAAHPFPCSSNLRLMTSDERLVPPSEPENNFLHLWPMIRALGLSSEQALPVETGCGLDMAVAQQQAVLEDFLAQGGEVTLALLGIGADGHTASLFTLEDVMRGTGRHVIGVRRPDGPDRVSLSAEFLRRAKRIVFLANSPEKAGVLAKLQDEPWTLPAGCVAEGAHAVEVWASPA